MASFHAPYANLAALKVARDLGAKVEACSERLQAGPIQIHAFATHTSHRAQVRPRKNTASSKLERTTP
jgi:hypothetical protein